MIHFELNDGLVVELVDSHNWLNSFLKSFRDHSIKGLVHEAVRITPEMLREIDRIKNYNGHHGDLEYFLRVKIQILLLDYVLNASNDLASSCILK